MKTGIFLTARLGSTRLHEKHLLKVKGKVMINYLIDRINYEFKQEIEKGLVEVIIVTGSKKSNQAFEKHIQNCKIFYGDDDNIPKRHLQAAKFHKLDLIVSVDGDDVLCSSKAMRQVYEKLLNGDKYVATEGLPVGLNAFGYSTEFLETSLAKTNYKLLETGWGRIFDNSALIKIKIESKNEDFLRFTLDYDEDFQFFKEIITKRGIDINSISDGDLIDLVFRDKIFEKNAKIAKEYLENFRKKRDEEEAKRKAEQK